MLSLFIMFSLHVPLQVKCLFCSVFYNLCMDLFITYLCSIFKCVRVINVRYNAPLPCVSYKFL